MRSKFIVFSLTLGYVRGMSLNLFVLANKINRAVPTHIDRHALAQSPHGPICERTQPWENLGSVK